MAPKLGSKRVTFRETCSPRSGPTCMPHRSAGRSTEATLALPITNGPSVEAPPPHHHRQVRSYVRIYDPSVPASAWNLFALSSTPQCLCSHARAFGSTDTQTRTLAHAQHLNIYIHAHMHTHTHTQSARTPTHHTHTFPAYCLNHTRPASLTENDGLPYVHAAVHAPSKWPCITLVSRSNTFNTRQARAPS